VAGILCSEIQQSEISCYHSYQHDFQRRKSWKDVKKINDYILLHEQKHFDIAELFVRKFRKAVAEKIRTSGIIINILKRFITASPSNIKTFRPPMTKIPVMG
jgi:hypothetical protein